MINLKDDEIETMFERISLNDPYSLMPIKTPIRSRTCRHLQCFDLELFIEVNRTIPKFECPVCNIRVRFMDLVQEEFFQQIIDDVDGDETIENVRILPDGTWEYRDEIVTRLFVNTGIKKSFPIAKVCKEVIYISDSD